MITRFRDFIDRYVHAKRHGLFSAEILDYWGEWLYDRIVLDSQGLLNEYEQNELCKYYIRRMSASK